MNSLFFGDTLLVHDPEWSGSDGTHVARPAVFLADNGDGTVLIMRTSTKGARINRAPRPDHRRLRPDGSGQGNSLTKACDLIAEPQGVGSIPWSQVIRPLGQVTEADADWIEDRLDDLGL